MAAPLARVGLDVLFRRFLSGDPASTKSFPIAIRPIVLRIARKYAWELGADQLEDVLQQTLLLLLQPSGCSFNAARGAAGTFIGLVARRAARDVVAQYAPPGRRTRPPARSDERALEQYRLESRTTPVDDVPEEVCAADGWVAAADARLDAEIVLCRAPSAVRHGLRRICFDGISATQACGEVGLTRFAFHRAVATLRAGLAA